MEKKIKSIAFGASSRTFRRKTIAAILGALPLASALAQSAPAGQTVADTNAIAERRTEDVNSLDTIVIVGTNRPDQRALQSLSPVSVITGDQLVSSGASTLSEALVRLDPSVNFPQNTTGPQAATNGISISLKGLTPDQTLVLVNGKRLVSQATITAGNPPMFGYMGQPTDVNIIPLSAIDHVEILKDGASAQYGADAVAGVVNVVLKSRNHGGSISADVGNYSATKAPHGAPNASSNVKGWKGFELPNDGFLTISGEYNSLYQPEQGVASPNPIYAPAGAAAQGSQPNYDSLRHLMGYAGPIHDAKFLLNAEVGITDDLRYYGELSFAHFKKIGLSLTVDSYQSTATIGLFPQGRDDYSYIYDNALTVQQGLRYTDAKLGDFDLSLNAGINHQHTFNALAYNQSLGLASPIGLNIGATSTSLTELNLNWVRQFDVGQFKPITASAGAAVRQDAYEQFAGEWAAWYVAPGAVIGPGHYRWNAATGIFTALNPNTPIASGSGISPANAGKWTRNVQSAFGDIEGQLTDKFSYGVAARAEHYSDFGSTLSGKLSARYAFAPEFALRSTLSNAFKAPSVAQENYQSNGSSVAQGTLLVPSLSLATTSPLAKVLGAQSLKPEKSINFSLGAVWEPVKDTSLTVDAYRIAVSDMINYSEALQDTGNGKFNAYLVSRGYQSGTIARFYVNGMDTVTTGLDITGKTRLIQPNVGTWDLSLGLSLTNTSASNLAKTPAVLAGTGVQLISTVDVLGVTRASPKQKLIVGQKLTRGDWTFDLTEKYYGSYVEALISTTPTPQTFGGQSVVDLDFGYKINPRTIVHFGSKNLFDTYPDTEWPSNRRVGQTNYPNLAPEGFAGRYLYTSLTLNFD